jgi:hypothetical protein
VNDDRNEQWEGIALVGFEDIQEVVILEEAHGSIGYLKMKPRNAFYQAFEDLGDVGLQALHLTGLKHLDQFRDEHDFLGGIRERPVLDQAVEQEQTERGVLGQEEHGATHEMFMEEVAGLDLMERNNDIPEEDDVLFP